MGVIDFFKGLFGQNKQQNSRKPYAPTQSGYSPIYTSFGTNIYASDIIVQSIRVIANEMMKLRPRHIRVTNGRQQTITDSSIARVLRNPNEYMTTADFLSKITILLELNKNVYIYPDYYITQSGEKYFYGLYPLKPTLAEYVTDRTNTLYIRFTFGNGTTATLPARDVIHWRKDYGVDDFFGGSMFGGNDDIGLLKTLQEYNRLTQSISKALGCSLSINGVMQYVSLVSEEKLREERDKFVADLRNGESSVLFLDNKAEYKNIPRDIKLVDKDTLNFFYECILRSSGVSVALLSGDYTFEQKAAFYESVLEAKIISLGQAMTKCIFSEREASYGNEIILYPDEIQNMSIDKRISWLQVAVPAGAVSKNEIRQTVGLPPIDGGDEYPRGYNNVDSGTMGAQTDDEPKADENKKEPVSGTEGDDDAS